MPRFRRPSNWRPSFLGFNDERRPAPRYRKRPSRGRKRFSQSPMGYDGDGYGRDRNPMDGYRDPDEMAIYERGFEEGRRSGRHRPIRPLRIGYRV